MLSCLSMAVELAGYRPGTDIRFAIDAASSELYDKDSGRYVFPGESRMCGHQVSRSAEEMVRYYESLLDEFPICSLEDGLVEFRSANGFFGGALRLILGFALIMAIRIGLKALLPDMMWCHTLRYGLMGLFGTFLWPWVFTKLGF